LGASTVLVVACDQGGIEGALLDTLSNIVTLKSLGVNLTGVILNKLYVSYMTPEIMSVMQQALERLGVQLLGMIPWLNLEHRGMIPEVEIRYEDFCAQAIETAEKNLNFDLIVKVATPPNLIKIDYTALTTKFKNLLANYGYSGSYSGELQ
jgi:cobyrinic acid a,c-diamide synthase